jgi:hypothetical protein
MVKWYRYFRLEGSLLVPTRCWLHVAVIQFQFVGLVLTMSDRKDDGRASRLSMEAKYHLRQELNLVARRSCDDSIKSFAEVCFSSCFVWMMRIDARAFYFFMDRNQFFLFFWIQFTRILVIFRTHSVRRETEWWLSSCAVLKTTKVKIIFICRSIPILWVLCVVLQWTSAYINTRTKRHSKHSSGLKMMRSPSSTNERWMSIRRTSFLFFFFFFFFSQRFGCRSRQDLSFEHPNVYLFVICWKPFVEYNKSWGVATTSEVENTGRVQSADAPNQQADLLKEPHI